MELNNRINKANKIYYALSEGIIKKKGIKRETKRNVYIAIHRPILTYRCESWVLSERVRKSK